MSDRVLIVSNRLPVTCRPEDGHMTVAPSSGGLVSALRRVLEQRSGLWIGWPGGPPPSSRESQKELAACLQPHHSVGIPLTSVDIERFYDGFSNDVLWPLFHYLLDKVRLDTEGDWLGYREVNQKFADAALEHYREGDLIWVHDYQLALVPAMLRQRIPGARIGFFLHIPFPSPDVFSILPWRGEILNGLLGADLIGFHTAAFRYNFAHTVARVLGVDLELEQLRVEDRTIALGVHPISIDVATFEALAERDEVIERAETIRRGAGGKTVILGVDRLDYTKGIPRRLLAIGRLLEKRPGLAKQIHYIQIAVPSRGHVEAYAALRSRVNEIVGRVNALHGTPTEAPIHLIYRSVSDPELAALYRAADVMLVTPLRDGMNLVAKEYVASRTNQQGVLILSEFAGAAAELREALLVNPYDLEAVAGAIGEAVEMSPLEQRLRMSALRATVRANDVHGWAAGFLGQLEAVAQAKTTPVLEGGAGLQARLLEAAGALDRKLFLDYDGTLVPIEPIPELAIPDAELQALLQDLASLPATEVHVVSGRSRDDLERWLGHLPIFLHGEHGFWTRRPGSAGWAPLREDALSWREDALKAMRRILRGTPGSRLEEKHSALAFHYRNVEPNLAAVRLRELRRAFAPALEVGAELVEGLKILEIRLRGVHKGVIAERSLAGIEAHTFVLAAGDDRTDEDLFSALPSRAVSVKVGTGASSAHYRLNDPAELLDLLRQLVELARTRERRPAARPDSQALGSLPERLAKPV